MFQQSLAIKAIFVSQIIWSVGLVLGFLIRIVNMKTNIEYCQSFPSKRDWMLDYEIFAQHFMECQSKIGRKRFSIPPQNLKAYFLSLSLTALSIASFLSLVHCLPVSLLGGRLCVYTAIRCAPYWGPTFYCIDRCRYSLPFWPAAAGERSVPSSHDLFHTCWGGVGRGGGGASQPLILFTSSLSFSFHFSSPLESSFGSLPALAKGQTVTYFCQNVTMVRRDCYTHTSSRSGSVFSLFLRLASLCNCSMCSCDPWP